MCAHNSVQAESKGDVLANVSITSFHVKNASAKANVSPSVNTCFAAEKAKGPSQQKYRAAGSRN